jgi:hypothetical protein
MLISNKDINPSKHKHLIASPQHDAGAVFKGI